MFILFRELLQRNYIPLLYPLEGYLVCVQWADNADEIRWQQGAEKGILLYVYAVVAGLFLRLVRECNGQRAVVYGHIIYGVVIIQIVYTLKMEYLALYLGGAKGNFIYQR